MVSGSVCGTNSSLFCSAVFIPVNALNYSKVCGKVRAYQVSSTDSFSSRSTDINGAYLDGISLTYGSPRQHIWSFAAALDEVGSDPTSNCPCINISQVGQASSPPNFVGSEGSSGQYNYQHVYSDDPLWDGAGCGSQNTCCSFNNPPWFYKQLSEPTTEDIEMRVCRNEKVNNEDIAVDMIEIFTQ